ncbi:MAG TPA: VOC family protein [Longimicrobiales bacterium]|nr:VOC family protein [Longimicrobiales bacterium]
MTSNAVESLVRDFEEKKLTRREVVAALVTLVATRGSEAAAQPAQVARVAQARTLNHISIGVSNVERAAEFYQSLLGLQVVSRPGNGGIQPRTRRRLPGPVLTPGHRPRAPLLPGGRRLRSGRDRGRADPGRARGQGRPQPE